MSKFVLEIPDEISRALRLPPHEAHQEMRVELALALYRRGALSLGKSRALTGLTRWQFEDLLGERQIPRHYSEEDLEEDLRFGRGG